MRLRSFAFLSLWLLGSASSVWAAPALIIFEDNGNDNAVYRQVIEGVGAAIVTNNLGHYYDHIDVLTGQFASRDQLFAQIKKRGAKRDVDVILLTHGSPGALSVTLGDIKDADIRGAGPLPRLRMVYMMGCYSASLVDAWTAAGAKVAVGHQDVNSLPEFFFPHYLKKWGEGASAYEAAGEAYRLATGSANALSTFVHDNDYLSAVGIQRSEPVLKGVDIDRLGHVHARPSLVIQPLTFNRRRVSSPTYSHTDFENLTLKALGAAVPQTTLAPELIPTPQAFMEQIKDAAWSGLKDSFPVPLDGLPGLFDGDADQIWLDGDAIRGFTGSLREWAGDKLGTLMDRLQGARISREGSTLKVAVYFDQEFNLSVQDESDAANWSLYGIHVPKTVRIELTMLDGVIFVSGLDTGLDTLNFKVKAPWLPDTVYLRSASVNLNDGKIRVEAGVLGDAITLIAKAQLEAKKYDGIDVWGSISRNLDLLAWPALFFSVL